MPETLALLEAEFPLLLLAIVLGFGLLIGSFLNVVIYRMPLGMTQAWRRECLDFLAEDVAENTPGASHQLAALREAVLPADERSFSIVWPASHCPKCGSAIRAWQNIPLVSYALLGGKCANCKTAIAIRYPLVELLAGLVSVVVVAQLGIGMVGITALILSYALIALSLIDYDTKLLPDDITLPLLWLGLIVNLFGVHTSLPDAVLGAVFGYLSLWGVYQLFKLVTGKEGMGFGDFKLLAMLGAWLGWQMLPMIIILSSLTGAVLGGALLLFGRDRNNPIPFGPYLAIAGWIAMLWGPEILESYLQFMAI